MDLPLHQKKKKNIPFFTTISKKLVPLLLCAFLLMAARSGATSYNVNSYLSFTNAITASVDGDIINFTDNVVVSAEVVITKALTFQGNGYTITVPVPGLNNSGAPNALASIFRVFNLNASGKTIVFNKLTIKGGVTVTSGGGVTIASGTTAKFNNCVISNGKGPSSAGGGGGINNNGTCYLYKTDIRRNAGGFAGGFLNYGVMFMEYSSVKENRSLCANCGGGGGASLNSTAFLYVNNSTFANNKSSELGGGFENYGGASAYFVNTSFTGNVAYGSYKGGAIAQHSTGACYLVNCLFAYNYYTNTSGASYVLDDVHAYTGTANLYYSTYMTNSVASGTVTPVVGNTAHSLAADGSTNDLFTGGIYNKVTDANAAEFGTASVFQPFLVNISGYTVPTLKTGSYALGKGCITGFTNGSGTPVIGYKNMSTSVWANLVSTGASTYQVADEQTNMARPATPATGALEKVVDNYIILKALSATNGTVNGATIYGDVYPSGTSVTMTAIPNAGYALTNWTYNLGGTGTVSGNPLVLTLTQNTSLTPNFASSLNYAITYIGNGNTGGAAPAIANYTSGSNGTIAANSGTLSKSVFVFSGWNTVDNGSGTDYTSGATYTGNTNLVLYAKWVSTGAALPVKLNSFTAAATNGGKDVLLRWETASENNNNHFEIQRSKDCSSSWESLGSITGTGNSSAAVSYSFVDKQPYQGSACYRIKQVDNDGKFEYSAVAKITGGNNSSRQISLYPNPASGTIYLTGEVSDARDISLFNQMGQNITPLCSIKKQGATNYSINIAALPAGYYLIKTSIATSRFTVQ